MEEQKTQEQRILEWAEKRNILKFENRFQQFAKVNEEIGEIAQALLKQDKTLLKDGLGDAVITLHILAGQLGYSLTECVEIAYNEIKNRTGKTIGGTFLKD